ncbi:glsA [Lepeophtheirus salmonis]|uniref:glutaminase n=1 Tax=Lepeophtheirus salmonis TaxID=72036 RepID=A0A7R8CUC3_LEPSM|nr:glsA [Lepeophtheirus salmonis]CAF2935323.1 glsA [Lepeophtheirus salmonis]
MCFKGVLGRKFERERRESIADLDNYNVQYQYNVFLDDGYGKQHANFNTIEDMLFEVFRNEENGSIDSISISEFLKALENTGLRRTDPRLKDMIQNLEKHQRRLGQSNRSNFEEILLGRKEFKHIIYKNIPSPKKLMIFMKPWKKIKNGKVADYISLLAREDPEMFGISICTVDGQRYSLGNCTHPFTMQSCCKPLNYGIALNELGQETVHQYVGVEPSGQKSNDLELDTNNRPHNPFVNSGAIVINSLLQTLVKPEMSFAEKFDFISTYLKRMGGGEYIGFNNSVFLAEREISDRNYALAYYMKEHKCFPKGFNLKDCLDFWFQCCSMEANCETMAVIVRNVCSLLHSCGFYEFSGKFAFKIGLPGKSSVAGSMMMVLPNTMGICIYSPRLDEFGNSCRGLSFCEELVKTFNFHRYDHSTQYSTNKIDPRRRIQDTKGDTIVSLLYSAFNGDLNSLKRHMFLSHNMNSSDFDGRTPLHIAATEGHLECVKFLITACEVNPEPADRWGCTPLNNAEQFGHHQVANCLRAWDSKK